MNDINDEDLVRHLLHSALPPIGAVTPARDLWPEVVRRSRRQARWTPLDSSLAAVIVLALLVFPKWFWFLAYHL